MPNDLNIESCNSCHFQTPWSFAMRYHVNIHHPTSNSWKDCDEDLQVHKCTNCNFTSTSDRVVLQHTNSCILAKADDFNESQCELCDLKTFSTLILFNHSHPVSSMELEISKYVDDDLMEVFNIHHVQEPSILDEIEYVCFHCPFRTSQRPLIKSHVKNSHPDNFTSFADPFSWNVCKRCGLKFKLYNTCRTHVKRHADDSRMNVKCKFCPFRTTKPYYLIRHTAAAHPGKKDDSYAMLSCHNCSFKVWSEARMNYHKKYQCRGLTESSREFRCRQCDFRTLSKSSLTAHKVDQHSEDWFQCSLCSYQFKLKEDLECHMKVHSSCSKSDLELEPEELLCPQCDFTTRSKFTLNIHTERKHAPHQQFQCDHCAYKTAVKSRLNFHNRVEHAYSDPDSSHFSTTTTSTSSLVSSTIEEQGYEHRCKVCGFLGSSQAGLNVHMGRKHKKSAKVFACPSPCNYKARLRHTLKSHQETPACLNYESPTPVESTTTVESSDEEEVAKPPIECEYCPIKLESPLALEYHVSRYHTDYGADDRKVTYCPHCDFTTISAEALRLHLKSHSQPEAQAEGQAEVKDQAEVETEAEAETEPDSKTEVETETETDTEAETESEDVDKEELLKLLESHVKDEPQVQQKPKAKSKPEWYHCRQCPYKSKWDFNLRTHVRRHHKLPRAAVKTSSVKSDSVYRCTVCDYVAPSKRGLQRHTRSCHKNCDDVAKRRPNGDRVARRPKARPGEAICDTCGYRAGNKILLRFHVRKFHTEMKNRICCPYCDFTTSFSQNLRTHIRRMHQSESRTYQCDHCPLQFQSEGNMKKHSAVCRKRTSVPGSKGFECKKCDHVASTWGQLLGHWRTSHTSSSAKKQSLRVFECEVCYYKTLSSRLLRYHGLRYHKDWGDDIDNVRCCPHCDYTTLTAGSLQDHMRYNHTPAEQIKWHPCEYCPAKFRKRGNAENHMTHVHKRNQMFCCRKCPYKTRSRSDLRRHSISAHKQSGAAVTKVVDNSDKLFHCDTCDHASLSRYLLGLHVKKYHKDWGELADKLRCCPQCDFVATRELNVDSHVISMHVPLDQIEWFHCKLCPFKAKLSHQLTTHTSVVHPSVAAPRRCRFCSFQCVARGELIGHTKKFHPRSSRVEAAKSHQCKRCGHSAGSAELLRVHAKKCAASALHYCSHCSFKTLSKANLKKHLLMVHEQLKTKVFRCRKCTFTAKTRGQVVSHGRRVHYRRPPEDDRANEEVGPRDSLLQLLDDRFGSSAKVEGPSISALDYTQVIRTSEDVGNKVYVKFKCKWCDFRTRNKYYLSMHVARMHSSYHKKYSCNYCEFVTKYKQSLDCHLFKLHGANLLVEQYSQSKKPADLVDATVGSDSGSSLECPDCHIEFYSQRTLDVHLKLFHRSASAAAEFQCEKCTFQSNSESALAAHVFRIHSHRNKKVQMTPHISRCNMCDFQSKCDRILKMHVYYKHGLKKKHQCLDL